MAIEAMKDEVRVDQLDGHLNAMRRSPGALNRPRLYEDESGCSVECVG